mgnify:CR=1 FL=1
MTPSASADPQALAQEVADAMWSRDPATQALGMRIVAIAPGSATLAMPVRADMLNGHGICHGGFMFTLADSAFAFACNGYNEVTVAAGFDVNLISAARKGDVLTAVATELAKSGRTGVYDIVVSNQRDERVAAFRGRSYTMKGRPVVEGLPLGKQPAAAD